MTYRIPHRLGRVIVPPDGSTGLAVYLLRMPDGDPQALAGTGALIWVVAADGEDDVPGALATLLDIAVDEVRGHVESYLAELVAGGLLEEL